MLKIQYTDAVFVYGDPSGNSRSTVDENNASFYDKYLQELRSINYKINNRIQKSAPEVALSASFINEIYESNLNGWQIIIASDCFRSIEDYLMVQEDVDGTMKKKKEKDKETHVTFEPLGHISDAKRYFITTVLAKEFEAYKARSSKWKAY